MLEKIIKFIKSKDIINNRNIRFLSLVILLSLVFGGSVFAEATDSKSTAEGMNTMIEWINTLMDVVRFVAHPMVLFVWWLLSPDWTFWEIIWLRPVLHQMWIYISNIVYIIFAFMLIVIAFMNIFWESKDYAIKSTLPKLIGWIIMVPFTWFIVSGVLSISNVLTASVLTLPYDTIVRWWIDEDSAFSWITIPSTITVNLTDSWWVETTKSWSISIKELMNDSKWPYNLLSVYAYWIFKIDKMKDITDNQTKYAISKTGDILKKLTFWMIFALIFTILVIAIFLALISRMTMLWMYAIFSPLFAVSFAFWWKFKKLEDKINLKNFISLAMVPVYVSAALSFGLMFLSLAINMKTDWTDWWKVKLDKVASDWSQTMQMGDKFKLVIKWNYAPESEWKGGEGMAAWLWGTGQWLISNVIISFIALAILWMAVIAALWASKITEAAAKPFAEMWSSVWKFVWDLPKYAPIPIPWIKWWISASWLSWMVGSAVSAVDSRARWSYSEKWASIWNAIASAIGLSISDVSKVIEKMNLNMKDAQVQNAIKNWSKEQRDSAFAKVTSDLWISVDKVIENSSMRDKLVMNMKEIYNIKDQTDIDSLKNSGSVYDFNKAFAVILSKNSNINSNVRNWGKILDLYWSDSKSSGDPSSSSSKPEKNRTITINNNGEHKIIIKDGIIDYNSQKDELLKLKWLTEDKIRNEFKWVDNDNIEEIITKLKNEKDFFKTNP